jgi:uncharacterized integral membrane protein
MRLITWLVFALIAILLVVFAVSNMMRVTLVFWPLPVSLEAPLYLVVLLGFLVGFLAGELVAWVNASRVRRAARERARRIETLERDLAAAQKRLDAALPGALPRLPANHP